MFDLHNKRIFFFEQKWIFSLVFCLFFVAVSGQNISELEQQLDTLTYSDPRYEIALKKLINEHKKSKQPKKLVQAYFKGINLSSNANLKYIYNDSAIALANKMGDLRLLVMAYQNMAVAYYVDKNYPSSLEYEFKGLDVLTKINEPYLYHKALYSIGAIQLYMSNYREALINFKKATHFFKTFDNFSYKLGYFNSLRSEAICYYYLNDFVNANKVLDEGFSNLFILENNDRAIEKAYFNITRAMVFYQEKEHKKSIELLKASLPIVIADEDFANEYLIYFYLAKNYWDLDLKEKAIPYFKEIDKLFTSKGYTNVHFLEAYRFLIENAQAYKNLEEQLYYTNRLLEATESFRSTQSYLSDHLFKTFDINLLEKQKTELENQIAKKHLLWISTCVTGALLFTVVVVFYIRDLRLKKQYKKNYVALSKQMETRRLKNSNASKNQDVILQKLTHKNYWLSYSYLVDDVPVLKETKKETLSQQLIEELDQKITCFEAEKMFLKPEFTLGDLTDYCKTNRSYLSQYFNAHKKQTFPDYINTLRIHFLLDELQVDIKLRKLKTEVIAQQFGYTNRRSFANAFLKQTGVSYSFFINKLEQETA